MIPSSEPTGVVRVLSLSVVLLAGVCVAEPAAAALQNGAQQRCIRALNQSGQKVLKTQGRENANCVKRAGKSQLSGTFTECLEADEKLKVARARDKTTAVDAKSCGEVPTFAYAGSVAVNSAAVEEELTLVDRVFGGFTIKAALDADGARCQAAVAKAYEKMAATFVKEFNGCKRAALASGAADVPLVEACIGSDDKNKIDRAATKILDTMSKKCAGVLLGTFFDAAFQAGCHFADTAAQCTAKLTTITRCRSCRAIARMDALPAAACDEIDNDVIDGSCAECGNGILESSAGEACDDGNNENGDFCDAACQLEPDQCGNGILDAAFGETCDDGNNDNGDCCDAVCQVEIGSPEGPNGGVTCSDTLDNDCDGAVDGFDLDCADPACPVSLELLELAAVSEQSCATNIDCADHSGVCDPVLARCTSASDLDSGWTGFGHNADTLDRVPARLAISCAGSGPGCGNCNVTGVDSANGMCRCANDNRTQCDEPLIADFDDCGGAQCQCWLAPPAPQSIGNTPLCLWNFLEEPYTGTANVDTGDIDLSIKERVRVYLGINLIVPCPYCEGDVTGNDGVRDGVCVQGVNAGQSCDVNAWSASFPTSDSGPLGAGASLDCAPDPGKNISGLGFEETVHLSTSVVPSLSANLGCGFEGLLEFQCPCSSCDNDAWKSCASNSDCDDGGICEDFPAGGKPLPNQCTNYLCSDVGGGNGECTTGPDDSRCDGILRADGTPFLSCLSNSDCEPGTIGIDAGACTVTTRRKCFLDPIVAAGGVADPMRPVTAAISCGRRDDGGGVGAVFGMPGPTRLLRESVATAYCADGTTVYTPGLGGCP